MENAISFHDLLEAADHLGLDEQETLIEILQRRLAERRRAEIVEEVRAARREFSEQSCPPSTPEQLMGEILS
jgi:hypothetical protein